MFANAHRTWCFVAKSHLRPKRFATASKATQKTNGRSNALLYGSTCVSIGLALLYYKVYHKGLQAMTPVEEGMHFLKHDWPQNHLLKGFDHASLRRGFQVYREVCSQCHSLNQVAWRDLVGNTHTADEAKKLAAEVEYEDGPDEEGNMFKRPGKLSDYMPAPYPNEEAARAANAGALPPDLSSIIRGRHGGTDYVYSLLTSYVDPPAGTKLGENLNFNPFFPGTQIAMARPLFDETVEFEDGTPASTAQEAKDVVNFLHWASMPELDRRKKMGFQVLLTLSLMWSVTLWLKRFKWMPIKTRQLVYKKKP
ncbi:cytochrome c1 Cyt1 [Schizosaccharomyces japonicus yFS275]|uniref:quinol--cytochrome-c reductase n=1 Tax=Schizosaccharomyces japonicus (strain yFS275 / FY16936) TaxID=402676 RepID=B6K0T2_SCHJY|nr:cytochrome c1 Cyt1 [Schizosaccharomyces japonicus yFS275]EEB07553.1 cytochrome c1 Cyt1 [Schizosaccharomyces japonicus yFS275]